MMLQLLVCVCVCVCVCACITCAILFLFSDGSDFANLTSRISFSASGQSSCVNVEILNDNADEMNETFTMELVFNYEPFDIPLDTAVVTIVDTGE